MEDSTTVLLVADDPAHRTALRRQFPPRSRYHVAAVPCLDDARAALPVGATAAVVLRASHPRHHARALEKWRSEVGIPLIVVTPPEDLALWVRESGVRLDQCIVEPLGAGDLFKLVRSQLAVAVPSEHRIVLSAVTIDVARREVVGGTQSHRLLPKEHKLLLFFLNHPRRDLDRAELLRSVWGRRGGSTTRVVDQTIARLRAKIEADPQNPQHILTIPRAGYRFEPNVDVERLGEVAPVPPQYTTRFFGRQATLRALESALASDTRLITVVGAGGLGKSRVVMEMKDYIVRQCGYYRFVDLTPARTRSDLLNIVARTIGAASQVHISLEDTILASLETRGRGVLVLDNFEHLVDHTDLIQYWVTGSRTTTVIVTSRHRLRIAEETCLELPPLSVQEGCDLLIDRGRFLRGA